MAARKHSNKTGEMVKLVIIGEPKWCQPCVEQHMIIEEKFRPKYGEEIEIEHVVFTEEKNRCLRLLDCAEDDVALPTLVAVDEDDDPINIMHGLHSVRDIEKSLGWDSKGNFTASSDDEDEDEDVEVLPLEDADSEDDEPCEDEKPAPKPSKRKRKPAASKGMKAGPIVMAAIKAKAQKQAKAKKLKGELRAKLAGKRNISTRSARG